MTPSVCQSAQPDPLRSAILSGVLDIVAQEGFEGATIRRVAHRAGCSAGAVQKRFATRDQLLRAAFELVVEQSLGRITVRDAAAGVAADEDSLLGRQRRATLETLPLDEGRRSESLVWIAYVLRSAQNSELGELLVALDAAVRDKIFQDLTQAQAAGHLSLDADPAALSDALLALVDGIAIRMLYTPDSEHGALLDALDVGLGALLTMPTPTAPNQARLDV